MRLYARSRNGNDRFERGHGRGGGGQGENEEWHVSEYLDDLFDSVDPEDADNNNHPSRDYDDPEECESEGEGEDECLQSNGSSEPTTTASAAETTALPVSPDPQPVLVDGPLPLSNTRSMSSAPSHSTTTPTPSHSTPPDFSNSPSPETMPPSFEGSNGNKDFKLGTGKIAAAILIPLLLIILLTVVVVMLLRRRRRRRQYDESRIHNLGTAREMRSSKMTGYSPVVPSLEPQLQPPQPTIMPGTRLPTVSPQPAITNLPPIPYARPPSTQPIILGPMDQSNTGNYYTGLDADSLSISESTTQGNGAYAMNEDPDEPPPPYRPRSVMNVSRGPSTRLPVPSIAESDESRRNLLPENIPPPSQSPFQDPDPDDDAVSDISEPSQHHGFRRGHDMMSAVSDLSYQNSVRRS